MSNKSFKVCNFGKIDVKEDHKDFYVNGYVATSHPDRASADGFDGDILSKSALIKIVEQINNRSKPEAGAVSESHDWIKSNDPSLPLAGVTCEPAILEQLPDNEWGVKVGTVLARTNPRKDEIRSNIEQGVYPGFSIEYDDTKFIPTSKEGKKYRLITDLNMRGFGLANRRLIANPNAQITDFGYKEMVSIPAHIENLENKQTGDIMENEQMMLKFKEMEAKLADIEAKEAKLKAELSMKEAVAAQVKEALANDAKMNTPAMKEAISAQIKEALAKEAPMPNTQKDAAPAPKKIKFKEMADHPFNKAQAKMKEIDSRMKSNDERVSLHNDIVRMQYKEAANLYKELHASGIPVNESMPGMYKECAMQEVGSRIELKETSIHNIEMKSYEGLQTDTNKADASWTYGSMYQSPVELNDIYGQAIVNQLNDQTTTWGKLRKEDWSGRSQIQFRARTGRNSTAAGYAEGANYVYGTSGFDGYVGRNKFQQPFAYYHVMVAVTGQEIQLAKAPGGMGDVWADSIMWSTADLNVALNAAIISTGDGTTESACLGFEGMILGTTGTLYARDIATYTTLKSHKESCSGRIDLDQLRKMIRYCEAGNTSTITNSNANRNDLVFFCNHLQRDFIYSLIQDMQRTVPTSARIGYEGVLEIDGVPVFADKAMNTDDIFLIDTANTALAINLPPTIEPLPVTADAKAAHIKIYFNLYSKAPSNNYWAYGFATS